MKQGTTKDESRRPVNKVIYGKKSNAYCNSITARVIRNSDKIQNSSKNFMENRFKSDFFFYFNGKYCASRFKNLILKAKFSNFEIN